MLKNCTYKPVTIQLISKSIVLLLLTFIISCQTTQYVEKKSNGQVIEKYQVLRSNKNIKDGEFSSYYISYEGGTISTSYKEKGFYKNGKKDSLWLEYYRPTRTKSNRIKSEGNYDEGKKVGIWITYKSEVIEKYDYDKNERLPIEVMVSINYPKIAMENGIQGSVFISYKVRSDCSVYDIKILRSLSPECDAEVIRVVKRLAELNKKYKVECSADDIVKEFTFKIAG